MYRWIEHPDELELHVEGATEAEVLEDATRALAELLRGDEDGPRGEPATRELTVEADDSAQLLVAWLEELVFLAETEAVIPDRVTFETLDPRGLRAHLDGHRGDPPHLVKAVTHHRLAFDRGGDGFSATVVLEV
ncbi:MAG: protein archease [Thermoleophilaceae bacterium]|jgi:SHS2 domain-containing protein|nr:protein archease [Thermoleophilaceae bacterium]MEA2369053.1 protein archease [Thermoleophilaceae bacterium]MEA2389083.1 protein archease [Thermoleophilaceae bacterium]